MAKLKFGKLKKNTIFILFVVIVAVVILYKQFKSSFGEDNVLLGGGINIRSEYDIIFENYTQADIEIFLPEAILYVYDINRNKKIITTLFIGQYVVKFMIDGRMYYLSEMSSQIIYNGGDSIYIPEGRAAKFTVPASILINPFEYGDIKVEISSSSGYKIVPVDENQKVILIDQQSMCSRKITNLHNAYSVEVDKALETAKTVVMNDPSNFNSTTCAAPIRTAMAGVKYDSITCAAPIKTAMAGIKYDSATCAAPIKTALSGIQKNIFYVINNYKSPVTLTATGRGGIATNLLINNKQSLPWVLNNTFPWTIKSSASKTSSLQIPIGLNIIDKSILISATGTLSII